MSGVLWWKVGGMGEHWYTFNYLINNMLRQELFQLCLNDEKLFGVSKFNIKGF